MGRFRWYLNDQHCKCLWVLLNMLGGSMMDRLVYWRGLDIIAVRYETAGQLAVRSHVTSPSSPVPVIACIGSGIMTRITICTGGCLSGGHADRRPFGGIRRHY